MNNKLDKGRLARQIAAAFAFAALVPAASAAAPLIVAGDFVKLYDDPNGGAFQVDVQGIGTTNDFLTFCIEKTETFSYGQLLKVGAVSFGAVNGGVSGGNPDPLSNETAWLYTQFTNGTLAGFSHNNASGNSLQRAIWFLEGELGASYTEAQLNTLDSQAKTWVDQAQASGWTDVGQVRVLNLLKYSSGAWVNSQDQLYITPIPEPETYAMLLAGLGLMGFVARRASGSLKCAPTGCWSAGRAPFRKSGSPPSPRPRASSRCAETGGAPLILTTRSETPGSLRR